MRGPNGSWYSCGSYCEPENVPQVRDALRASTMTKLMPGVFGLYFLLRREWRPLVTFAVVFTLLAIALPYAILKPSVAAELLKEFCSRSGASDRRGHRDGRNENDNGSRAAQPLPSPDSHGACGAGVTRGIHRVNLQRPISQAGQDKR